jgi:hypothetical protein
LLPIVGEPSLLARPEREPAPRTGDVERHLAGNRRRLNRGQRAGRVSRRPVKSTAASVMLRL